MCLAAQDAFHGFGLGNLDPDLAFAAIFEETGLFHQSDAAEVPATCAGQSPLNSAGSPGANGKACTELARLLDLEARAFEQSKIANRLLTGETAAVIWILTTFCDFVQTLVCCQVFVGSCALQVAFHISRLVDEEGPVNAGTIGMCSNLLQGRLAVEVRSIVTVQLPGRLAGLVRHDGELCKGWTRLALVRILEFPEIKNAVQLKRAAICELIFDARVWLYNIVEALGLRNDRMIGK